ncbi:hypothetical protein ABZT34_15895 [Streptomyces sp. NPDC005329]|uniref:hypothetical protein n=1 Tax=Streptomyces sp. NPDC005329 TaxID=3157034 RepID=UPI0033BEE810
MDVPELEQALLDHLVDELNDEGRRAASFLRSARALIDLADGSVPEHGSLIAYTLREAMKAIPSSQSGAGSGGEWKILSREVVEAKQQLLAAAELTEEDREIALQQLVSKIDALDIFHKQDAVHQRRLIAVIVNRTGTQPLSAGGVAPISAYQKILNRLDRGLHGGITITAARALWRDCVNILRQLFTPPDIRLAELDDLAHLNNPNSENLEILKQLVVSPYHLRRFLGKLDSPAWLNILVETSLLDPPPEHQGWPMFAAVDSLKAGHSPELAPVLDKIARRFIHSEVATWYPARAALDISEHGHAILKLCLKKHPRSAPISSFAISAAEKPDATGDFVEFVANIVLNHSNWARTKSYVKKFLEVYTSGVNEENGLKRLKILAYRVSNAPQEELETALLVMQNASLSDYPGEVGDRGILPALLDALVLCLKKLVEFVNYDDLISHTTPLPALLQERTRSWILANSRDVDIQAITHALNAAIATRGPLADDETLIQRVVSEMPDDSYVSAWRVSLGDPPDIQELGAALADRNPKKEWVRAYRWSAFLPSEASASWSTTVAVISGAYGPPARRLEPIRSTFGFGRSPISSEELAAMTPQDAAQWIANWSPSDGDFLVSARELGRALESAVSSDAREWSKEPIVIASRLHHPTYISHYLQGLANGVSEITTESISQIVDLIELTRTHPWSVTTLGNDDFDYDPTWRPTEHAGISLIKALAQSDLGFAGRDDYVWSILQAEATDTSDSSGLLSNSDDYLETAINRPFTRALEAVFSVISMERKKDAVRHDGLRIIEELLALTGREGAEARAIIAPKVRFIYYVSPDWLEAIEPKLFGNDSPSGLGQLSIDLALQWGQPYSRLLEQYRSPVRDAVRRGAKNALTHYLIAMLWEVEGYSPEETLNFLTENGSMISEAGKTLGLTLRGQDDVSHQAAIVVDFWNQAIVKHPCDLFGFGWMAEVSAIADSDWNGIMLNTLIAAQGKVDLPQSVAERASGQAQSKETLAILDFLVRGLEEEWDRREVASYAKSSLLSAESLKETAEYRRLRNTLLERGLME